MYFSSPSDTQTTYPRTIGLPTPPTYTETPGNNSIETKPRVQNSYLPTCALVD